MFEWIESSITDAVFKFKLRSLHFNKHNEDITMD